MKSVFLFLISVLISGFAFSQESGSSNDSYNAFSCKNCKDKFFVATNSGVINTPLGIRAGLLCKTGAYIGWRFGKGKIYHSDSDLSTSRTTLFSITTGIIKPVFIKNDFSVHVYAGAGYGKWWAYRWERWTKDGYEIEAGAMISNKRIMVNLGGTVLNGDKTYPTGDFTVGLGYRF